jgi:3-methyladenine DNA glycosylase AlkC
MPTSYSITESFGENLAIILSDKILDVYPKFDKKNFTKTIKKKCVGKTYTQRVELLADELKNFLPQDYKKAIEILSQILGAENENETGMFTNFYWLLPVGKFVEKYGLDDFDISIKAISEITKRNTGEYAIRPYIRKYPKQSLAAMKKWAGSKNFHLRRLASEGLRPKLPWASKLDTFIENPKPVFEILEMLKEDEIKFVQKSVANHVRDYLKVNQQAAAKILKRWSKSKNENTKWIIKHATRK